MERDRGKRIEVGASGRFSGAGYRHNIDLIRVEDRTDEGEVVLQMRGPHGMLGSYLQVDRATMDRLAHAWQSHRAGQTSPDSPCDAEAEFARTSMGLDGGGSPAPGPEVGAETGTLAPLAAGAPTA